MPPAARAGDVTAHGTPLTGGGSSDVIIGGQPAWRAMTDVHTCPVTTGPVPHVGGPVTMGSSTVLINGAPAARQGDAIVENGPPNTIAMGEPTVIIDGGSTSTEPAWAASLYEQLGSYVDEYNRTVASADTGLVGKQLRNEVVNLYVTTEVGEAVFSFRTDGDNRIQGFHRGPDDDATLRMETDRSTVDRITGADEPADAFRRAVVEDVDIHGLGPVNAAKWWVLGGVKGVLTVVNGR